MQSLVILKLGVNFASGYRDGVFFEPDSGYVTKVI